MPRRLGYKERNRIYPYIIQRDGDYCLLCAVDDNRCSPAPPGRVWDLDHADSNTLNWSPENIHAVCYEHHQYLSGQPPGEHKHIIQEASVVNMREREKERTLSGELSIKTRAGYRHASPEMIANEEFEGRWLECAYLLIGEHGIYPERALINDCAKYAGCARTTSKNYYEVHVLSPTFGEFEESLDTNRNKVVILRNGHRNGHKQARSLADTRVELEVKK